MTLERSRVGLVCFAIGVAALLAALVLYIYERSMSASVWVAIGLGVAGLAVGVLVDPERVRRALGRRQARYGGNALLLGGAFFGILVVANVLAINNPQRIDLTEDQDYSLRPETLLLLSELSEPVSVLGFYSPDRSTARDRMRPILQEYEDKSGGLVTYEFIDPVANPLAADLYGVVRDGSMAVTVADESHLIEFPSETEITSAIVRLSNPENRTVYFLTGHGELDPEGSDETGLGQLKETLESKNYAVKHLNLVVEGAVPVDAAVIVAAAPQAPVTDEELDLLEDYLRSGGGFIALLEPSPVTELADAEDSLNTYLKESWGVGARDDFVVDLDSMHPLVGLSFSYGEHPITERIQGFLTQFPTARSIEVTEADAFTTDLISSSGRSWGETDFESVLNGSTIEQDDGLEVAGPLALAVSLQDSSSGSRLVVVGDADFATNGGFFAGGNGDLMVNSVDWAAKLDNLIDITPRERTQRQVVPATMTTVLLLGAFSLLVIPGLIIAFGAWVWWSRRKRM